MKRLWRTWKYALGSFSDEKTEPYDNYVVLVRSVIFVSYLVTNCFIIAGNIRHWNDNVPVESTSTINSNVTGGTHYENNRRPY